MPQNRVSESITHETLSTIVGVIQVGYMVELHVVITSFFYIGSIILIEVDSLHFFTVHIS